MKLIGLLLLFFMSSSFAFAGLSPLRPYGLSYEEARQYSRSLHEKKSGNWVLKKNRETLRSDSAERTKQFFHKLDLSKVNELSEEELQSVFNYIRDTRFLNTNTSKARRLTWLYPDDGCYARAAVASFNTNSSKAPSKVFVFGDLKARTNNSPYGAVEWWYHVAIAYRVKDVVYVIDPALNPFGPTPLQDWGLLMVKDLRLAKFSVCQAGTYDPDSNCNGNHPVSKESAYQEQNTFLPLEWSRIEELGRSPEKELLGNEPPWATQYFGISI